MTKMIQVVEEMGARLGQIADAEQTLVRALSEALSRVDHKLLQDVRAIATEHEARRATILQELQGLAARIGAFPAPREPLAGLEFLEPAPAPIAAPAPAPQAIATPTPVAAANGNLRPFTRGGDWRQATNNIEDELGLFFKERAAS